MQNKRVKDPEVYSSWLLLLLVALLTAGLFFRFTNLNRKVYGNDEVWTSFWLSGQSASEMIEKVFDGRELTTQDLQRYQRVNSDRSWISTIMSLAADDPKQPPLYYVLLRLWTQFFGDSISSIRSLSAFISLLVFPCLYWLCRELFETPRTAWIAIALMAVSPFHVLYAQEARPYSLWTVTILLSSAVLLRTLRRLTWWSWSLYAATIALGLYSHTLFGLIIIAQGAYVIALRPRKINPKEFQLPKVHIGYLLATLVGLIAFAPWAVVIISKLPQLQGDVSWLNENVNPSDLLKQWTYNFHSVFLDTGGYLYGIGSPFINLISLSILALVASSIYFLVRSTPKRVWLFILTLSGSAFIWLALADLIWGGRRSGVARYLIPSYLGIQLGLAHLLATQIVSASFLQRKIWQVAMVLLVGSGIMSCAIISQAEIWWNKASSRNIPEVARIINRSSRPLIISDSSGLNPGNVVSLSHLLDPKVRFRLVVKSKVPTIPDGFSDVFLFNPSESLRRGLEREENYKVEPIYKSELWRLRKRV